MQTNWEEAFLAEEGERERGINPKIHGEMRQRQRWMLLSEDEISADYVQISQNISNLS